MAGLSRRYDKRFGEGKSVQLSMNLNMKDEALLRAILQENSDETIRRKLIEKYTKYYRYWKDFNVLIAVLAGLGLILGLYQWESEFYQRGERGIGTDTHGIVAQLIIALTSVIALLAIFIKWRLQAVWRNYRNPLAFFKKIVKKQVELGLVNEQDLTDNYKDESSTWWVLRQPYFWAEVFIVSLFPYPIRAGEGLLEPYFYMKTTNWVDGSGAYSA